MLGSFIMYNSLDDLKAVYIDENGYYRFICDGRLVHRVVVETFRGCRLPYSLVVHHINMDKLDNRIENLQVMSWGAHESLHDNQFDDDYENEYGNGVECVECGDPVREAHHRYCYDCFLEQKEEC